MKKWFSVPRLLLFISIILLGYTGHYFYQTKNAPPVWVTTTVERGTVSEVVSVSGFVKAAKLANLSFPSNGTVTDILVTEGEEVIKGQLLATLANSQLVAERAEMVSALRGSEASYFTTLSGPREETLTLAETNVKNAQDTLARVTREEANKVANARSALLSSGLSAVAINPNEDSPAPTVSGTYQCHEEGQYLITLYRSNSYSGFSYTTTGLEAVRSDVSDVQPSPLGICGLSLLFTPEQTYHDSVWKITIPNKESQNYTNLKNTYELSQTFAKNNIASAQANLNKVLDEANLAVAPARPSELTVAEANIDQIKAKIRAIDIKIADRSILAPFPGTVTKVDITTGETAQASPVISVLAEEGFTVTARIPEIDITKISIGQKVEAVFDAKSDETLVGNVSYISPVAEQIDSVAYFEAIISLTDKPVWLRSGLNADITIITGSKEAVLRLPKRFVTTLPDGTHTVLTPRGTQTATTTIEVLFTGNDSYLEITGLTEGETIIAP